ncbi:MAG TPA: hypothetical protein VGR00_14840, partial [Thermoanaerobaculia bacterium]|nr:hypothetical protein [Thermoanaerobaculia bacterium]
VEPENPTAKTLYQTLATRVGQRERPVDNAKIKELEKQLRQDPENVALLLQLAKLYRLEKDFVGLMKFHRKLKSLAPGDAYTQGQIASLVGGPAPNAMDATGRRRPPPLPDPPTSEISRAKVGTWAFGAFILVLLVAGVFLARRPSLKPSDDFDPKKAAAIIKTLKEGPPTPVPAAAAKAVSDDEKLQKALEKGALLEKEGGPKKALAFYRDSLSSIARVEAKAVLLMTIADASAKAGDVPAALSALDEAAALGGATRLLALYRKAELLEAAHDDAAAQRLLEQVADGDDAELRVKAMLKLGMAADRAGDAAHALALYEAILSKAPRSPEANSARLGAGALYRQEGRKADARRMFEEVKASTTAGSDFDKSADAGLKSLE